MASPFSVQVGEDTEFRNCLAKAGLTAEIMRAANQDETIAEAMIAAALAHPHFTLVRGLFTRDGDQIARITQHNNERGWGFTAADFNRVFASIPAWPEDRLVALVLVPYLEGKDGMSGVERTFQELWQFATANQHDNWRWNGYDKAGPDRLRLLKGITHKPGLRWEVIDLGANRDRIPLDVRSTETSPHAGILAAAALHPEWVKSMDGDKVPYVWIPGYEVNVPDGSEWRDVPGLDFGRDARWVGLDYDWCDAFYSEWSVPALLASRE